MSRIFDELKKFKESKPEEPPPPTKVPPLPTESLKIQFTPKPEKPKKSRRKLLIIALSAGGLIVLVTAILIPRLLFEKKTSRKEPPPRLVLPQRARPAPEKTTQTQVKSMALEKTEPVAEGTKLTTEKTVKKPPLEVLIEEIVPLEPSVQEIVEIVPKPVQSVSGGPEAVVVETSLASLTPEVATTLEGTVKPAEPSVEVVELAPAKPPEVTAVEKPEKAIAPLESGEKPQIEIKAMTPIARAKEPPVEKATVMARSEKPEESSIEAKTIPKKETLTPLPKVEAVPPIVSEVPREAVAPPGAKEVSPPTQEPAESVPSGPTPEEEVAAGRRNQRVEKFKLALFYQKSGELKKAEAQYQELLKEDPMDAEARNNLGSIYQELGQYERAEAEFRKAVLLKPDYLLARNNLGVALYKRGNLEGALSEFTALLEVNPRDIQGLTNLGVIAKKQGDLFRAKDAFQKVLQMDLTHAEAHYNLAIILEEEGSVAKAVYHYQKFLEFSMGKYASLSEEVVHHLADISKRGWK